jgi:hypothetical protein
MTVYRALQSHAADLFADVLCADEAVTMGELRARLARDIGVRFRGSTVQRANTACHDQRGNCPLIRDESGLYCRNEDYNVASSLFGYRGPINADRGREL